MPLKTETYMGPHFPFPPPPFPSIFSTLVLVCVRLVFAACPLSVSCRGALCSLSLSSHFTAVVSFVEAHFLRDSTRPPFPRNGLTNSSQIRSMRHARWPLSTHCPPKGKVIKRKDWNYFLFGLCGSTQYCREWHSAGSTSDATRFV